MKTETFDGYVELSYKYDCKFGTECDQAGKTVNDPTPVAGKIQNDLEISARASGKIRS